jgi:gas vesicle protein
MHSRIQDRSNGFFLGLVAGGAIGAGLTIMFAPRLAAQLRRRVTRSARDLSDAAVESYHDAGGRVADAVDRVTGLVDDATKRGQSVRDDVADAIGRGAREVEKLAMASKTGRSGKRS